MAEAEEQVDLDLDASKSGSGKKNLILYGVIALLIIGLGVTTTLLLLKDDGGEPGAEQEEEAVEELTVKEAHYLPLDTLVVNFQEGPVRFLQLDVQLMASDPDTLEAVQKHMPAIRNDVLFLLSSKDYETVRTREGKEQLREEIRSAVQGILDRYAPPAEEGEEEENPGGKIEAVYFTSFVMQ